jgi:hypothetical protein
MIGIVGCNSKDQTDQTPAKKPQPKKVVEETLTALDYFGMVSNSTFDEVANGMDEDEQHSLVNDGVGKAWKITSQTNDRIELVQNAQPANKIILQAFAQGANPPLIGLEIISKDPESGDQDATTFWQVNKNTHLLDDAGGILPNISANDYVASPFPDDYEGDIAYNLKDATTIQTKLLLWDDPEFQGKKIVNDIKLVWNGSQFEVQKAAK